MIIDFIEYDVVYSGYVRNRDYVWTNENAWVEVTPAVMLEFTQAGTIKVDQFECVIRRKSDTQGEKLNDTIQGTNDSTTGTSD